MMPSKQNLQLVDFEEVVPQGTAAAKRHKNLRMSLWVRSALLILLGLLWGGFTAASMAFEDWEIKIQASALLVALVLAFLSFREASLTGWVNSWAGLCMTAHVAAAVASGFQSDAQTASILRYAALLPAFSVLLSVARGRLDAAEKVRFGLTLAGIAFVVFHLTQLDFAAITDPSYRITVYLNPNNTAFIAAMTGLSAVGWAFRPASPKWARGFWLGIVLCCAVLLFATKSRTGSLALASGALAFSWIRFRTLAARGATIGVIALGLAYAIHHREAITDTMSLDQKDRSIETGTGRYDIWSFLLTSVIPKAPWLGIGPGKHNDVVLAATGSVNAHNGFLTALSETGIAGTLPLLVLTTACLWVVWQRRRFTEQAWVAALFVAGMVESFGESIFFSIGNPASLLFLLAVASLATPLSPESQCEAGLEADVDPDVSGKILPYVAR